MPKADSFILLKNSPLFHIVKRQDCFYNLAFISRNKFVTNLTKLTIYLAKVGIDFPLLHLMRFYPLARKGAHQTR